MEKNTIDLKEKNYKKGRESYQLILPMDYEVIIPEDDSVRLLSQIVERMDLGKLYRAYSSQGRNPGVEPMNLFKVIVYAYMNGIYSSREIEKACRRDINFMWLLAGETAPSHSTISRFRKDRLGDIIDGLFNQLIEILCRLGEVTFENLFLDGTKIEANANKYTFVWKKAVEKNEAKMQIKVKELAEDINKLYFTNYAITKDGIMKEMQEMLAFLDHKKNEEGIEFVYGSGKKKSNVQKLTEALEKYMDRQDDYEEKKVILEERNSYSKTDNDATFMRLKDDHMKNGQLKAAYNVQLGVEGEYVAVVGIFQNCNDLGTLVPMLDSILHQGSGIVIKNLIAYAGYESEENYVYLEKHGITTYIKPQTYEIQKEKIFKNDISKRENMEYDSEKDEYTCHNGKQLKVTGTRKRKNATGYESEVTVYESEDCSNCPCKSSCTKAKGNRQLTVSKKFIERRGESLENIKSENGIILRTNRSIQSEGAFGVLKQNMQFTRFLTRGKENVKIETLLLCFGYNINKLHAKIQSERCGNNLHLPKTA